MITLESRSVRLADIMRRPDIKTPAFDDMARDLAITGHMFEKGFEGVNGPNFKYRGSLRRQIRMISDEGWEKYMQTVRGVAGFVAMDLIRSSRNNPASYSDLQSLIDFFQE